MFEINYKKITEVLQAFYRTTGARVGIFDENHNEIICYPKRICKICEKLRENSHIDKRCKNSDKKAFEICKKTKTSYTYECDMGLFESVSPIFSGDKVVAYVMMGQVACLSSKGEILEHANKYFRDVSEIEKVASGMKKINLDQLESSAYLMNICIEYLFSSANIAVENDDKFLKIDKYILENFKYHITAEDVCEHFQISRTTLHYSLKKRFQMSFTERLNFLRIERAKEMLLDKKPIEYICDEIGISEKSYFFKIFKKVTGKTTKEFLFENIS